MIVAKEVNMSDPLGRHFCEYGQPEEDGSNWCSRKETFTNCLGYSEDCECDVAPEPEVEGFDEFTKDQMKADAEGLL